MKKRFFSLLAVSVFAVGSTVLAMEGEVTIKESPTSVSSQPPVDLKVEGASNLTVRSGDTTVTVAASKGIRERVIESAVVKEVLKTFHAYKGRAAWLGAGAVTLWVLVKLCPWIRAKLGLDNSDQELKKLIEILEEEEARAQAVTRTVEKETVQRVSA